VTPALDRINRHKEAWGKKPLLRRQYHDWYKLMAQFFAPGRTVEIGSGSGNLKEYYPDIISGDIIKVPWCDLALDAHRLPFGAETLSNIILFDVLHHLENPALFLEEAQRVLSDNGRIILMEPYISPASYPIYKWLHPEPVDLKADPFEIVTNDPDRKPFDANQAIPTLMFKTHRKNFEEKYPNLYIYHMEKIGTIIYPLTGGYGKLSLLPARMYNALRWLEQKTKRLADVMAFRMLVVLEYRAPPS